MRTATTSVILAHLAAAGLVGCPGNGTTGLTDTSTPAATTPAPATPSATATTTAAATGEAGIGDVCKTDDDCKGELECQLEFDGANFSEAGTCTDQPVIYEGRPLLVDGRAHVAPLRSSAGWLDGSGDERKPTTLDERQRHHWARLLTVAAQDEHASIPSFARALCLLVSLGAPANLVAKTQHAIGDEIRHARLCATWAERLGAAASEPGPLPEAIAPFAGSQPGVALLDDVFWGGCVGETLAAHRMQARASTAPLAELGEVMAAIADDEARHAALAFETVRWLIDRDVSLRDRLDEHLLRFASTASEGDRATLTPLLAVLS